MYHNIGKLLTFKAIRQTTIILYVCLLNHKNGLKSFQFKSNWSCVCFWDWYSGKGPYPIYWVYGSWADVHRLTLNYANFAVRIDAIKPHPPLFRVPHSARALDYLNIFIHSFSISSSTCMYFLIHLSLSSSPRPNVNISCFLIHALALVLSQVILSKLNLTADLFSLSFEWHYYYS